MERLDGKEKWSVVESPRERRSIQTLVQNEAVFVQYLDAGLWHLAFYNDGKDKEMVSFNTVVLGKQGVSEVIGHQGTEGSVLGVSLEGSSSSQVVPTMWKTKSESLNQASGLTPPKMSPD